MMKRLLSFIAMTLATVVTVELIAAISMRHYVKNYQIPGDYRTIDYLIKSTDDDVIVLGSSVALNSTMSSIIEDSLNMPCWNGACNGQAMPYFLTILDCILKHHTPQIIVLGMRPDELSSAGKGSRYNMLAPYYGMGYDVLDGYLEEEPWFNRFLQQSTLYRYNTIWFRILLYNFIEPGEQGDNGFIAKPIPSLLPELYENEPAKTSSAGKTIFKKMVNICKNKGVRLAVFYPPTYYTYKEEKCDGVKTVEQICKTERIPCFTKYNDDTYRQHPEWFYDNVHLNKEGAKVFSKELAKWLKQNLE